MEVLWYIRYISLAITGLFILTIFVVIIYAIITHHRAAGAAAGVSTDELAKPEDQKLLHAKYQALSRIRKNYFWFFAVLTHMFFSVIALECLRFKTSVFGMESLWGISISWGILLFLLEGVCLATSFQKVDANERGMKAFYGKLLYELRPGIVWIPWYILIEIKRAPRTWQLISLPGARIKKDESDNQISLLRITFPGRELTGTWDDPLEMTMDADVRIVSRLRVKEDWLHYFFERTEGINHAKEQLAAIIITRVENVIPAKSAAYFRSHLGEINDLLEIEVNKYAYSLGLDVEIQIQGAEWPEAIQEALAAIPTAQKARIVASGKSDADVALARGLKAVTQASYDAAADGLEKIASNLNVTGNIVYEGEIAKEVFKHAKPVIIFDQGDGGRKGIARAGMEFALGADLLRETRDEQKKQSPASKKKEVKTKGEDL